MPDVELSFYRSVAPSDPLSQGDIFANVRCVEPANPPSEKLRTVVVLSHGCEIDKQDSTSCYTAAVRLFKRERDDIREAIRSGRTANTIYLPRNDALNGEGFVDRRLFYRVRYEDLHAASFQETQRVVGASAQRLVGLEEQGVLILRERIVQFFSRTDQPIQRAIARGQDL